MPGTDSNSGRFSLLYHSLNSCTCWASISTYTMKIPRPFCAICPSPLWSVAAILLPRLVGTRSSRLEPRRDTRHQLGSHLSGHSPDSGLLSAIFRLIEAHRNEIRAQPASFAANRSGRSPRGSGTRGFASFQAHLCLRRLSHLTPPLSCRSGRRL